MIEVTSPIVAFILSVAFILLVLGAQLISHYKQHVGKKNQYDIQYSIQWQRSKKYKLLLCQSSAAVVRE